ncbi:acyl-coenzyme A thioesterase 1 [Balamuthia mandrillaris]
MAAKNATVLKTALYGLAPVVRVVTAHSTVPSGLAPVVRAVTAHSTALCSHAPNAAKTTIAVIAVHNDHAPNVAKTTITVIIVHNDHAPNAANTTIAVTTVHNDHAPNVVVITDETSAHSALALFVRRDTTAVNVLKYGAKGAGAIIAKTVVFVQRSAVVVTTTSWRTALSFVICVNAVMRAKNNVLTRCLKWFWQNLFDLCFVGSSSR